MSHHSTGRDDVYPEDGHTHYPQRKAKKGAKSKGPLHNVGKHLNAKARALKKRMEEVGGRFTKK